MSLQDGTSPYRQRTRVRARAVDGAVIRLWAALVAFSILLAAFAGQAFARGAPDSFADLAEELLPSVVNIRTATTVSGAGGPNEQFNLPPGFEEFFDRFRDNMPERQRRATSLGSGFIIDSEGYIVTNNHVIKDAEEIYVLLQDNTELAAELIGADDKTDLALLKVESDTALPAVPWGKSDAARVGDWVVAIGNPLGFGGTVTAGIISARGRDINSGPYDNYIQTDASINKGNSGGPLFNMDGEVIGINTAIFSPNGGSIGIGFAVPSNLASRVVGQLREFGSTRRGWLGVTIQQVTDEIADSLDLPEAAGALVSTVHQDSPARVAGVETGDVILTFDGRKVPNSRRLPRMVADTAVGQTVPVEVWRDGEIVRVEVTLGQLEKVDLASLRSAPRDRSGPATVDQLGLALAPLDGEARERFNLDDEVEGVVIAGVDRGSDAEAKELAPGDVIVEVNQQKVATPDDVADRVQKAREEGRKSVLMLISQGGSLRFVVVKFEQG
ncbi:MAG: DegQ family serine endoprotease [Alphaproteobacteria bacterium]|nr:DegQ family serine endoprotease [Alphaproteobacteria bacterium]